LLNIVRFCVRFGVLLVSINKFKSLPLLYD